MNTKSAWRLRGTVDLFNLTPPMGDVGIVHIHKMDETYGVDDIDGNAIFLFREGNSFEDILSHMGYSLVGVADAYFTTTDGGSMRFIYELDQR